MTALRSCLLLVLVLAGCGGTPSAPVDAATPIDAAAADAPIPVDAHGSDAHASDDAGVLVDARSVDAAEPTDAPAGPCSQEIADLGTAAEGVWFTSESDRTFVVRTFAGEGTAAPTQADVVRLAASPSGATASTRETARFADHFTSMSIDGPEAGLLVDAIDAALTDTIYVAIVEDPSRSAEVRVILAGRTACGDLVFLESVSVET